MSLLPVLLLLLWQIIDDVLPLLWEVRLSDPEIILRVVSKCQGRGEFNSSPHPQLPTLVYVLTVPYRVLLYCAVNE